MWLDNLSFAKDYIGRYTSYEFDKESIRYECVKHDIKISIKQLLSICKLTASYTTKNSQPRCLYIAATGNGSELFIDVTYTPLWDDGTRVRELDEKSMCFYVGLQGKTYKYNGKGTRNYNADIYPKYTDDEYYLDNYPRNDD